MLVYKQIIERELSFEELDRRLGLSRPVLSKHLQRLQVQGLAERNPLNRKYRATIWKHRLQDLPDIWDGTEPESIAAVTRVYLEFLGRVSDGQARMESLGSLLESMLQRMTGNLALNISLAMQSKRPGEVLEKLEKFYSSYFHPLILILALVSWQNRKVLHRTLELVGSSMVHEADHEFGLREALKVLEEVGAENIFGPRL